MAISTMAAAERNRPASSPMEKPMAAMNNPMVTKERATPAASATGPQPMSRCRRAEDDGKERQHARREHRQQAGEKGKAEDAQSHGASLQRPFHQLADRAGIGAADERPSSVAPLNTIKVLCCCTFSARRAGFWVSKSTSKMVTSLYSGCAAKDWMMRFCARQVGHQGAEMSQGWISPRPEPRQRPIPRTAYARRQMMGRPTGGGQDEQAGEKPSLGRRGHD